MPINAGFPEVIPDHDVVALEAGITLGELGLAEGAYGLLRESATILSLRIDDHPVEDGWRTLAPDGTTTEERTFVIPLTPVVVPGDVFSSNRAFSEWTWDTHGALGRLLIWDDVISWWMLSHPDLEMTLICASTQLLERLLGDELQGARETPVGAWIPTLTAEGQAQATALARRYGLRQPA